MTQHRRIARAPFGAATLAAGFVFATTLGAQELPRPEQCTVFVDVSLLTMDGEEVAAPIPGQDVLVCGSTIRAVGVTGSLDIPPGTTPIDGSGQVLLPGLVDGHVHLYSPLDLDLNLAWGVTGVRNLFGNPASLQLRGRLERAEIWGPRFFTAGPIVDGDPAVWPGSVSITTADDARRVVAEQVEAGYDFVKVYSLLEPEPFFAALDAARELGVPIGGHVPRSVPLADAVEGGMRFIEHLQEFLPALQSDDSPWLALSESERAELGRFEATRLQVEGFSEERLAEVAGWMVEHDVWNIPTFVVIERITAPAEQKRELAEEHPQMRTVSKATLQFWNPSNDFRLQDVTEEQLAARHRSAQLHAPIVKALHDAGAELMLGTDTPNPFVFPGYSVHEELERFVGAGLTPWQALRTATVQPARFLGLEDTLGRVVPGLEADLLLLDADPLENIMNTKRIVGLMTRGRWLDRTDLDARLTAVAKAYGNHP